MNSTNLPKVVQGYLDHLATARRVTPATLKNYRSTCAAFAAWAEGQGRALESASIQDFVATYRHAASANTAMVRLVGLAKYAKVEVEVVRAKESVREVQALTSDEALSLIEKARMLDSGLEAGIVFLAETGLRFDEFMRASTTDVFTKKGMKYLKVEGKGRKQRSVPLTASAYRALRKLPERTDYFEKKFRRLLAKAGKRAGIKAHVHPHLLRASFISIQLNERNTQAIHIATIVGHASVDTMLKHYYRADLGTLTGIMG